MSSGIFWVRLAPLVLVALGFYVVATADIIHLNSGGTITGEIVREDDEQLIIKTRLGEVSVSKDTIERIEKGSLKELFEQYLKEVKENDSEGHVKVALWAKTNGLAREAELLFKKVLEIDPENAAARAELGYRKYEGKWLTQEEYNKAIGLVNYKGEWVPKEDAEKLTAGFVKREGKWVKEEDIEKTQKGYRKLDGKWVTEEEYYNAKGYVKHEDKWITKEELDKKKKEEDIARQHEENSKKAEKNGLVLRIACIVDAQEEHFRHWEKMIQSSSGWLWDMTAGTVWIREVHIFDKSQDANIRIKNLDLNNPMLTNDHGKRVSGYVRDPFTPKAIMFLSGGFRASSFVHELGHLLWHLQDHYGTQTNCLMNASAPGTWMKAYYCDECWKKVCSHFPEMATKKRPSVPQDTKSCDDYGEPPPTKILVR